MESEPSSEAYVPMFNLDAMSFDEITALIVAVESTEYEYDDPQNEVVGRVREALIEDISRYPSADFERGSALFETLANSDNPDVRCKAGFAIGGLLRAAGEQAETEFDRNMYKAMRLGLDLLLDETVEMYARQSLGDAIEHGELSPKMAAFVCRELAGELEMVHNGEVEPRWEARRRRSGGAADTGPGTSH
jgi:hypothetical protein